MHIESLTLTVVLLLCQVSERMVLAQKAYILFYMRKDEALPSGIPVSPRSAWQSQSRNKAAGLQVCSDLPSLLWMTEPSVWRMSTMKLLPFSMPSYSVPTLSGIPRAIDRARQIVQEMASRAFSWCKSILLLPSSRSFASQEMWTAAVAILCPQDNTF